MDKIAVGVKVPKYCDDCIHRIVLHGGRRTYCQLFLRLIVKEDKKVFKSIPCVACLKARESFIGVK